MAIDWDSNAAPEWQTGSLECRSRVLVVVCHSRGLFADISVGYSLPMRYLLRVRRDLLTYSYTAMASFRLSSGGISGL